MEIPDEALLIDREGPLRELLKAAGLLFFDEIGDPKALRTRLERAKI